MNIGEEDIENNLLKFLMQLDLANSLFLMVGLISGLLGGMLGIGGGVITVPYLYFFYLYTDAFPNQAMQFAVCTSLAVAWITSAVATYFQIRKKAIVGSALRWMAPTLLIGCVSGSILAHTMASPLLGILFGILATSLGIYFFFPKLPPLNIAPAPNKSLSLFSLGIGLLSSLLGVGGGSIAFPVLLGYGLPAKNASATSSSATLISAAIGTTTYLILTWNMQTSSTTLGYIDIPALIFIGLGAAITTPLGVKLVHSLPLSLIKRIFGVCLSLIGLSMLIPSA